MSVSVLLKPTPPQIGELVLDAALTENHDYLSRVTSYPVEDGSDMTDHIQNEPEKIGIEGFVTNNPIRVAAAGGGVSVDAARTAGVGTRAIDAFNALMLIRDQRQPVTIVTNLKTYESMALESINFPKGPTTGDALRFTSMWVKVRKVKSETVFTEELADNTTGPKAGTADQASSDRDLGKQNTTTPDEASQSWAFSLLSGFGG
jgi:Dit-like phage tail protein